MVFISITRLRIRSLRFLPGFARLTLRSLKQVKRAEGFQGGGLLPDRSWTFWTMTAWGSQENMRSYITSGDHLLAMKRLLHWCDEASVVHWEQPPEVGLPTWLVADQRMRGSGRPSKVLHPSPHHADLSYRAPRLAGAAVIRPVQK